MQKYPLIGVEIISITVQSGYADSFIAFESCLTRLLTQKYPMYIRSVDLFQSTVDLYTFFVIIQYNQDIYGAQLINADIENIVQAQYAASFPFVVSRTNITTQDQNRLMDHYFTKIC